MTSESDNAKKRRAQSRARSSSRLSFLCVVKDQASRSLAAAKAPTPIHATDLWGCVRHDPAHGSRYSSTSPKNRGLGQSECGRVGHSNRRSYQTSWQGDIAESNRRSAISVTVRRIGTFCVGLSSLTQPGLTDAGPFESCCPQGAEDTLSRYTAQWQFLFKKLDETDESLRTSDTFTTFAQGHNFLYCQQVPPSERRHVPCRGMAADT